MDIQYKSLVNALMGVTPDPLFLLMAAGFLGVDNGISNTG